MMIIFYGILFIILGFILTRSADWVVKALSYFSHTLHVKSFLFGFVLLGFATTIPEMFVAYQSVADGVPQISVGNLLGGSILLLSFVMGTSAIVLKRITLVHRMSLFDIATSSAVIAAPAFVLWDGTLTKLDGTVLIALYVFHTLFLNREQHVIGNIEEHARHVKHAGHALVLFGLGFAGLLFSTRYIVAMGVGAAHLFSIHPFVIGLFLITFGTNLPELTIAREAITKKRQDIAFGGVLGSAVVNTPILGIIALFSPFSILNFSGMRMTLVLLCIVVLYFFWAAARRKDITRGEGIVLFLLYLLFLLFELAGLKAL